MRHRAPSTSILAISPSSARLRNSSRNWVASCPSCWAYVKKALRLCRRGIFSLKNWSMMSKHVTCQSTGKMGVVSEANLVILLEISDARVLTRNACCVPRGKALMFEAV